jgi:hypothetical protein
MSSCRAPKIALEIQAVSLHFSTAEGCTSGQAAGKRCTGFSKVLPRH